MLIYIDGPVANPECKPKDEIDHTKIDKNQVYSSAYNSKLLFGGAVIQLEVNMLAVGGADNFDIGGNPAEDAEEEDLDDTVEMKLDLLESCVNLEDMTELYPSAKAAEKECKNYFKDVLLPYMNKKDAANIKTVTKHAMTFVTQVFGKRNKVDPSKSIESRFPLARTVRNASFGEDGDYNGCWMFVFDEDQDPCQETKAAYNSKTKYVWLFAFGHEEIKY